MIKLTFLGDVMCKKQLIDAYETEEGYDFSSMFSQVKSLLAQSDFVFANLETPISLSNNTLTNQEWCFNSPFEFASAVKDAGIQFVATANNHCLDRGVEGVLDTIKSLDKLGLLHTGTFADENRENCIVDVDSVKIGVLSYTYGTNAFSNQVYLDKRHEYAVNLFQNQELSNVFDRYFYYHRDKLISKVYNRVVESLWPGQITGPIYEHREYARKCKKKCVNDIKRLKRAGVDLIVMYMHAGGQYNDEPTAYTKDLTEWLLNQGVDIVVGSHEHVVHGGIFNRIQDGKLATYSLGNFDGVAGVYAEPMDKLAEYSVAWHVYIEARKVCKSTYTILKTVRDKGKKIKVVPCFDLVKQAHGNELRQLLDDMGKISLKFSAHQLDAERLSERLELDVSEDG